MEYGWGRSSQESSNISETRQDIGPRLLLRKSHTRFRLVSKSTTLDDHEGPLRTVFQNTCVNRSPHENLNEDRLYRLYCQRRRYSPMIDSDNVRFMRIFVGVRSQQWGNRKRVFSGFRTLRIFGTLGNEAKYYTVPCRLSTDPKIRNLVWNPRKICGSSVDAISSELGTLTSLTNLTNNANRIITVLLIAL